jgi:hypothetical protein
VKCPFGRNKKFEEEVEEYLSLINEKLIYQGKSMLNLKSELKIMANEIKALQDKITELIADVQAEGDAVAAVPAI